MERSRSRVNEWLRFAIQWIWCFISKKKHLFLRKVVDYTRDLDFSRPVTMVLAQSYASDLAVKLLFHWNILSFTSKNPSKSVWRWKFSNDLSARNLTTGFSKVVDLVMNVRKFQRFFFPFISNRKPWRWWDWLPNDDLEWHIPWSSFAYIQNNFFLLPLLRKLA